MVVDNFINGFFLAVSWPVIIWMILGLLLGIFIGALPGMGPSLGMAIVLPLTIALDPSSAIILLIGIYSGAMYGGSIAAILINAPGTAAAAATTFDGYPMSRRGESVTALSISACSSAIGGAAAMLVLLLLVPLLTDIVLLFGPPEFFMAAIAGIALISVVSQGSIIKGAIAGSFGLLISTIGISPVSSDQRFTLGSLSLYDGLSFIAVLIGLFALAEMINLSIESGTVSKKSVNIQGSISEGVKLSIRNPITLIKSSFIGMAIGAIPGAGASIANFFAYGEAKRVDSDPDSFGEGNPKGVVAAESANNGCVAGSIIPAISFGIPGSGATAVLIGGLIMHGIRPGPQMFGSDIDITYAMIIGLLIGNIIIFLVGLSFVTKFGILTKIDTDYIIPIVIVLAMIGAFLLRRNWIDPATVFIFGIIGYSMKVYGYSLIAIVLGVVLGPIAEANLLRSLDISGGSWSIFYTRPVSIVLLVVTLVLVISPMIKISISIIKRNNNNTETAD